MNEQRNRYRVSTLSCLQFTAAAYALALSVVQALGPAWHVMTSVILGVLGHGILKEADGSLLVLVCAGSFKPRWHSSSLLLPCCTNCTGSCRPTWAFCHFEFMGSHGTVLCHAGCFKHTHLRTGGISSTLHISTLLLGQLERASALGQGLENGFCKELGSKYIRLCQSYSRKVFVASIQVCHCNIKADTNNT